MNTESGIAHVGCECFSTHPSTGVGESGAVCTTTTLAAAAAAATTNTTTTTTITASSSTKINPTLDHGMVGCCVRVLLYTSFPSNLSRGFQRFGFVNPFRAGGFSDLG